MAPQKENDQRAMGNGARIHGSNVEELGRNDVTSEEFQSTYGVPLNRRKFACVSRSNRLVASVETSRLLCRPCLDMRCAALCIY